MLSRDLDTIYDSYSLTQAVLACTSQDLTFNVSVNIVFCSLSEKLDRLYLDRVAGWSDQGFHRNFGLA